jgi:small subunit ribosomal protein S20
MANHKSAIKRIRANSAKRLRNRYQKKTTSTLVKNLKAIEQKDELLKDLPKVLAAIDKLAKKNVFHKNKAANLKSQLMKRANAMGKEAPAAAPAKATKAKAKAKKK